MLLKKNEPGQWNPEKCVGVWAWCTTLFWVVREGPSEAFELKPERQEKPEHREIFGKSILGRGKRKEKSSTTAITYSSQNDIFCCIRILSLFISVTPVICHIFWETLGELISKLSLPWHSSILWLSPGKASICMQQRIWRKRSGYGSWPQDLPLQSFPKLCFSFCLLFRVKEQGPKHQTVLVLLFYHMLPSPWVISLLPQPSESREEEQKMGDKEGIPFH